MRVWAVHGIQYPDPRTRNALFYLNRCLVALTIQFTQGWASRGRVLDSLSGTITPRKSSPHRGCNRSAVELCGRGGQASRTPRTGRSPLELASQRTQQQIQEIVFRKIFEHVQAVFDELWHTMTLTNDLNYVVVRHVVNFEHRLASLPCPRVTRHGLTEPIGETDLYLISPDPTT